MKKLLTLLFAFSTTTGIFAQGSWVQKADFGGTIRAMAVAFAIGNKGYIGTGYDGVNPHNDFWEYDPSANSWTQKANFGGQPRINATGFAIGNKGYIGTGHTMSTMLKDFWEYNPISNSWIQKADFGGVSRFEAVGFSIGNKGYIGTGLSVSGAEKDFWEYDPSVNSWIQKSDFSGTARYFSVGFSIAGKGYIGTGEDGSNALLDDFWEYDTLTDSWLQRANFSGTPRRAAVGFSIGSKGYIGTGEPSLNDFWEFDPATNSWIQKSNFSGGGRAFAIGLAIGNNGYIGTGRSGVTDQKDFWEFYSCSATPEICMVTVDSASKNNVILWDKTSYQHVDSFIVYREVGFNNYQPIAAVPYDSLSMFIDTVRTKYFPNTGDPNAGTYKYKLQIRDSCGGLSPLSQDHNTVFIINNSGTFSWPQLYLVGGSTNPVNNYVLMRDNTSNGNWTVVNSVAGSQQTITDPQYATYQSTASWRVETQWSISCTPTKVNPQILAFNSSRSNIFSFVNGVNEFYNNSSVSISPNPFTETATLQISNAASGNCEFKLMDIYGKEVKRFLLPKGGNNFTIERDGLSSGMYFYKVSSEHSIIATGKLIIE